MKPHIYLYLLLLTICFIPPIPNNEITTKTTISDSICVLKYQNSICIHIVMLLKYLYIDCVKDY